MRRVARPIARPRSRHLARGAALLIAASGWACTAPPGVDACLPASTIAPIVAIASVAPAAAPASLPAVAPRAVDAVRPRDPAELQLEAARIVALAPAAGLGPDAGTFTATLADPAGSATLTVARVGAPIAYRRPLAYARLAAALGMHVVPAAVERRLPAGAVAALLPPARENAARSGDELRILNDGTVTALLVAPAPSALGSPWDLGEATRVDARASSEVRAWERWAASPEPVPGESARLTRDFVEMLVLDYLAANPARRTLLAVAERDGLVLDDNREAFPQPSGRHAIDQLLRRLRPVARFPRGLRAALIAFDRESARAALAPGAFEEWLVSPRALVELDERRAGLLSLVEARIAERGEAGVLSL